MFGCLFFCFFLTFCSSHIFIFTVSKHSSMARGFASAVSLTFFLVETFFALSVTLSFLFRQTVTSFICNLYSSFFFPNAQANKKRIMNYSPFTQSFFLGCVALHIHVRIPLLRNFVQHYTNLHRPSFWPVPFHFPPFPFPAHLPP